MPKSCRQASLFSRPRGLGVSSVRLFDTMRMARVPVILSDEWVEPIGPAWREFSLRIPERDFHCIPDLLEKEKIAPSRWVAWRASNGKNGFRRTFAFIA